MTHVVALQNLHCLEKGHGCKSESCVEGTHGSIKFGHRHKCVNLERDAKSLFMKNTHYKSQDKTKNPSKKDVQKWQGKAKPRYGKSEQHTSNDVDADARCESNHNIVFGNGLTYDFIGSCVNNDCIVAMLSSVDLSMFDCKQDETDEPARVRDRINESKNILIRTTFFLGRNMDFRSNFECCDTYFPTFLSGIGEVVDFIDLKRPVLVFARFINANSELDCIQVCFTGKERGEQAYDYLYVWTTRTRRAVKVLCPSLRRHDWFQVTSEPVEEEETTQSESQQTSSEAQLAEDDVVSNHTASTVSYHAEGEVIQPPPLPQPKRNLGIIDAFNYLMFDGGGFECDDGPVVDPITAIAPEFVEKDNNFRGSFFEHVKNIVTSSDDYLVGEPVFRSNSLKAIQLACRVSSERHYVPSGDLNKIQAAYLSGFRGTNLVTGQLHNWLKELEKGEITSFSGLHESLLTYWDRPIEIMCDDDTSRLLFGMSIYGYGMPIRVGGRVKVNIPPGYLRVALQLTYATVAGMRGDGVLNAAIDIVKKSLTPFFVGDATLITVIVAAMKSLIFESLN